jgi:hypothetical protein
MGQNPPNELTRQNRQRPRKADPLPSPPLPGKTLGAEIGLVFFWLVPVVLVALGVVAPAARPQCLRRPVAGACTADRPERRLVFVAGRFVIRGVKSD